MRRLISMLVLGVLFIAPLSFERVGAQSLQQPAASATFHVNTIADTPDADQADGVCSDASGHCSLRAAIMQADFATDPNTITVPSGVYLLTRAGDDDGAVVGDLDITHDVNIQGAGAATSIVDGNGSITHDRVFQVLNTAANVSLSNLTIRHGQRTATFDEGGGMNWQGPDGATLNLTNVIFDNNVAYYDGGLALNYPLDGATVDLENVTFHANVATAAAGGLGADFGNNSSQFLLRNSTVYSNSAYQGAGLYFQGSLAFGSAIVSAARIYSNTASGLSGGIENWGGDANDALNLWNSQVHDNSAGVAGGAIGNHGTIVISNTTINANKGGLWAGGLYDYQNGLVDVRQSTISNNQAQTGGGMYFELFPHSGNGSILTMTNSTLSSNLASQDGAGLYLVGSRAGLYNDTIAGNHILVPQGIAYPGLGGGLYMSKTAIVTFKNTLIAYNTHEYGLSAPIADDCYGPLDSLGYNLIQDATNCSFSDDTLTLYIGYDPLLGPLAYNGGPTQTQAPALHSVVIDTAQATMPGCTGPGGAPLTTDQRGFARPHGPHCDIGAVEYYPPGPFMPLIRR